MIQLSQKRLGGIILFILIILLWCIRWSVMNNPYFWDEMGVYGYGVQYLLEHGISILPKDLPPEISRGHPLLFYSLHAFFLKLFGSSLFVSRCVALTISSLTLIASYKLARVFVPSIVAVLAPVLLAFQNIFLAQSTFVLPEMLIALLTVLAFTCYFQRKFFWCILFLALGVWVKESHIITAGFVGIVYLIETIVSKKFKTNFPILLCFAIPLIALIVFLGIQKIQNGWYFFPYHTALVSEGVLAGFQDKLNDHLTFIFNRQGRFLWPVFFIIGALNIVFFKQKKELFTLVAFVVYTFLLFSLAFYLDRYLMYLYPIICTIIIVGIFSIFRRSFLSWGVAGVMCLFSFFSWSDPSFRYDASLSYEDVIEAHQSALDYFCKIPEQTISYQANFPINMSIWDPRFGYVDQKCISILKMDDKNPRYLIFYDLKREDLDLVHSSVKNEAVVNIYKNNGNEY